MKGFIEVTLTNGIDGVKKKHLVPLNSIEEIWTDDEIVAKIWLKNHQTPILTVESYDEIKQKIEEEQS
jgi:hypothetical protein